MELSPGPPTSRYRVLVSPDLLSSGIPCTTSGLSSPPRPLGPSSTPDPGSGPYLNVPTPSHTRGEVPGSVYGVCYSLHISVRIEVNKDEM